MKTHTYILFACLLNSCCGSGIGSEGTCRDDFGKLTFDEEVLTLNLPHPSDAYFIRKLANETDSNKMVFLMGASYLYFEYHFNDEPNFNPNTVGLNMYIYSIPSLNIRDTLTNLNLDVREQICGSCDKDKRLNSYSLTYKKNGVPQKGRIAGYGSGYIID